MLSLVAQMVKRLPTMREIQVPPLCGEDPLEKEMATHSSTLAWKTPWMEEHGRLQPMELQGVRHDWAASLTSDLVSFTQQHFFHFLVLYKIMCVSHSVVSDSWRPPGLQPITLLCPRGFRGKILESVAISSSRGSSQLRDQTRVFCSAGGFFTIWSTREAPINNGASYNQWHFKIWKKPYSNRFENMWIAHHIISAFRFIA